MAHLLEREGDRRFETKAAAFTEALARAGPEQTLYRALFEALGYSKNVEAFASLATGLPIERIHLLLQNVPEKERLHAIEALLFGAAGLLLHRETNDYSAHLDTIWQKHKLEPLNIAWRRFRIRPENSPERRVAAAARLLHRFFEKGLITGLEQPLHRAIEDQDHSALIKSLLVEENGYWSRQLHFEKPCAESPTLLGKTRAADIVVNVALPFFYALAKSRGDVDSAKATHYLYATHLALEKNHITERMEALLLPGRARTIVTSARRQQGLIGLYKQRCFELKCGGCALEEKMTTP